MGVEIHKSSNKVTNFTYLLVSGRGADYETRAYSQKPLLDEEESLAKARVCSRDQFLDVMSVPEKQTFFIIFENFNSV